MPTQTPRSDPEVRLGYELRRVERHVRAQRIHRSGLLVWSGMTVVALALLLLPLAVPALVPHALPLLASAFVVTAALAAWLTWRSRAGLRDAAALVERQHPELDSALHAAVEQQPDAGGNFHFLQRRVIDNALQHARTNDWAREPRRRAQRLLAGHLVAMSAALGLSVLVMSRHVPGTGRRAAATAGTIEVTPGNAELERGSSVIIAARFGGGDLPRQVTLVWQSMDRAPERRPLQQSLADPVFATTLPSVTADGSYYLEHDGDRTPAYQLTVYDRPALVRADAALDYPEYTGLPDRTINDTRRVSAVVGTALDYQFLTNRPVAQAALRQPDGTLVPLVPADQSQTRFRLRTVIDASQRYTLHLEDSAGRTNAAPTDIRIEALENRRPELKLTFPRGDQRVSPIEEVRLQAEARDDFGLRDFGFAVTVGTEPPQYLSLATKPGDQPAAPVQATLENLLALEARGATPDQLVTWFAWADDIGPDGQLRRTSGDLSFAEVRALDEIFRESETGASQSNQAQGGGPGDELLEIQRQLSVAIWRLRSRDPRAPEFATDAATLHESQRQAQQQLATIREQLDDARARRAAEEAANFMEQSAGHLSDASDQHATAPLDPAWTASQGAYQALLRMQPRTTDVAQSRNGRGGGGGARNQRQLNQLQFRNEEDRYATETQAQPPPTPEEREQLQVLARLRELARRQQDLNQRLQELQTALAAAEDEARREEIRRELKRLEDEQRQMLTDLDDARQGVDRLQPGQRTQDARQQLDRTREEMRRAGEQLAQGEVGQALAAGTRARENLQRTSEDFRRNAAGRFDEQMREARRQARELASAQQEALRELEQMSQGQQSLDDSAQREALAQKLEAQAGRREELLNTLRQVTEESEASEPQLHRQLYDVLRQQGGDGTNQRLASGAELLRRGFVAPAVEPQTQVARAFDELQRDVERAAGAVLGDETSELRYVQRELDELSRELQRERGEAPAGADARSSAEAATGETLEGEDGEGLERSAVADASTRSGERNTPPPAGTPGESSDEPSGSPSEATERTASSDQTTNADRSAQANAGRGARANTTGGGSSGGGDSEGLASLEDFARAFGEANRGHSGARGPLTGGDFGGWADRLRTVEELVEEPALRQRLSQARFNAEEMRRDFQRHSRTPRWDLVEQGVANPLQEARTWVRRELSRRDQPDALQPVDRDPVPERYAESVRKYYEALGSH